MGFTESEVGHFTLKKWLLLFKEYQKFYNFKISGNSFKRIVKNTNPNGWIPF